MMRGERIFASAEAGETDALDMAQMTVAFIGTMERFRSIEIIGVAGVGCNHLAGAPRAPYSCPAAGAPIAASGLRSFGAPQSGPRSPTHTPGRKSGPQRVDPLRAEAGDRGQHSKCRGRAGLHLVK